jgi:hypothetical protein
MTPDTIRKTTMIDENDTHTADLLNSPVGPVLPTVTVEGWGTGTVAELGHHIHQLRDERDAARHALADLERRTNSPDALAGIGSKTGDFRRSRMRRNRNGPPPGEHGCKTMFLTYDM